jgi:hypothetical protein
VIYTIIERTELRNVRGEDERKKKYLIADENNNKLYAMYWSKLKTNPIVYDLDSSAVVDAHQWFYSSTGYMYNHGTTTMHKMLADHYGISRPGYTIDHINCCKLDNRRKNLRAATQGEQNSNRGSRSDKLAPPQELVDAGIDELPRHVRWDGSESKFVIECHPFLINQVRQGTRKKATMSGTKSTKCTVLQKYQDIIARLEEMNDDINGNAEFKQLKAQNFAEYQAIRKCILEYEGIADETQPAPTAGGAPTVESQRRTAAGKKTVCALPPDSGLTAGDIPKHCYYKAKTESRGDKFVIDHHPDLVKTGKRTWATTEASRYTTKQKYDMLMAKLAELAIVPVS